MLCCIIPHKHDNGLTMRKCVIFDMDGVIINSEPIHVASEKDLFDSLGVHITQTEHDSFIGTTSTIMWRRIKKNYGLAQTIPELITLERAYYLKYLEREQDLKPVAGVVKLITKLKAHDFLLSVASSSPHSQIDLILDRFDLRAYFRAVVSGDDVENGKPHPDIFLKTARLLNVLPEKCIVIEDSYNGVTAAVKAKMKCIGFKNPHSGNQDLSKADKVITSFAEVLISELESMVDGK
jgi:HAD superfamily hydrolase (TIGR01509 family)